MTNQERGNRLRRPIALWVLCAVGTAPAGCAASSVSVAGEWTGKRMTAVVQTLGEPTESVPLIETGGKLLFYAGADEPHYVFEISPDRRVISATEIK